MQFFVGTSAYSVPEWKGSFYPEKLSTKKMLNYYAQHFSSVEANYTFRTMPTEKLLTSWASQVPETFRFSLKAPQTITHFKRLKNVEEEVKTLLDAAVTLKDRLGPLLFQLPPNFKLDLPRLEGLLALIQKRVRVAFEFRNDTWFDPDVFECLRANSCALCLADTDETPCEKVLGTTDLGYVRLRRDDYTDASLRQWIKNLRAQAWDVAYVYFKHEDTGTGPKLATRFLELAAK